MEATADFEDLELLDIKEVVRLLGVSLRWMYRETSLNRFPHLRVAGRLRFRRSDIARYLERCQRGPSQQVRG
jgi:excisionase family DNA binding protein